MSPQSDALAPNNDIPALVERAFRFRGDVTITTADGGETTGYLYNRDSTGPEPYAQLFESALGLDVSIPYAAIAGVRFTGRDTASGKHFESFQRRRAGQ